MDIKVLYVNADGFYEEHSESADSVKMQSFKTANHELTDADLGLLLDNVDASSLHQHDSLYFRKTEFIDVTTGVADAGKPIKSDATGHIDHSFILDSAISHDALSGVANSTAHIKFPLLDGTRPFTGDQSMGGNKITNLAAPTLGTDAVNKAYADSIATGLLPHANCAVATTANIALTGLPIIDTYQVVAGDRVLVKDQTDAKQNGVYVAAAGAWSRSADLDNSPLYEIVNGVFIPMVMHGAVSLNKPYVIVSMGTGPNGEHIIGTDDIVWALFTSPTQLQPGNGIAFTGNIVSALLEPAEGLQFIGNKLAVKVSDIAGQGLKDDGSNNLAIDFSTAYNDQKAVSAADLSSQAAGKGASIIGIQDAAGNFAATNVEGALAELYADMIANGVPYTAAGAGVSKGDLVYVSANDTAAKLPITGNNHKAAGLALTTQAGGTPVVVLANDTMLTGVLTGAVAGTTYYWNGTGHTTTIPSGTGAYVWMTGIAKNATDLHVQVQFVKKNA